MCPIYYKMCIYLIIKFIIIVNWISRISQNSMLFKTDINKPIYIGTGNG